MIVHLIRHAQAVSHTETLSDEHRFLTCRGRKRFRKLSGVLRKLDIDPEYIFTSPKIRAVQTAEILAGKLLFNGEVIITPVLSDFSMESFRELLQLYPITNEFVLVGHDPDFSDLVGQLLNLSECYLTKGSIITLSVSLKKSKISTDIVSLITSGSKIISKKSKVVTQLQKKFNTSLERKN